MGFYVEYENRPYHSRPAAEDIHVGTLVNENGSDAFERADGADVSRLDYLAAKPRSADWIADDEDVDLTDFTYKSSENDLVPGHPLSDGDTVKVRTAKDTGGNEPTPDIQDGDVVGIIDTSAGTLSSSSEYEGRVVEEGYTDGDATTYNRSNNNFVALGVAFKDAATSHDVPVRVNVDRENLQ